jgi:hypothetical protein
LRVVLVVAVIGGLGAAIVPATLAGPTTYADPLTGVFHLVVLPGGFAQIHGNITGEDYLEGNFTVVNPPGALVTLAVYNSTDYATLRSGVPVHAIAPPTTNVTSARIVFAAPYTDLFYFVFENPYPPASHLTENLYVSTTYESNVVIG